MSPFEKSLAFILIVLLRVFGAEGGREGDSLALVALMDANPENLISWNTDTCMEAWKGVWLVDGRVDSLYLYQMRIDRLPAETGNLTQLRAIHLMSNRLATLPPEIGDLLNLKHLNLAQNKIIHVPSVIGTFPNLVYLNLRLNKSVDLPPQIGGKLLAG